MTTKELLRNEPPPTDLEKLARWAFGLLGRQDLSRAEDIWAPEAVDHFLPIGDAIGRDGIVEFFEEMFAALPDLEIEVEHVLVSAPFLVVQWTGTGTFAGGPFQGIRPTGRRVEFRGCDVVEMSEDNLVLENTIYWDNLAFARQIGMLPAKGSLGDRLMTRAFNGLTWVRTFGGRTLSVS